MNLPQAIREVEARLGRLDRSMTALIAQYYGRLSLSDLLALVDAALSLRDPSQRLARLSTLMGRWDAEARKLDRLPADLLRQFPAWVEAAREDTQALLTAQGMSVGLNLDPARERAILETAQERFRVYWAAETPRFRSQVQATLLEGLDAGRGPRQIGRELRDRVGVSQVRAVRIARTEMSRARQTATQARHEALGVTEYEWLHAGSRKGRQDRPEHVARSGKVFRYDKPPADGPPGFAVNCRCSAIPRVPEENP